MMLTLKQKIDFKLLGKRILRAIIISLTLLTLFLTWVSIMVGEVESWMYVPYITVAIGSIGAGCAYYYLVDYIKTTQQQQVILKVVAWLFFIACSWFSFIFALDQVGLWD